MTVHPLTARRAASLEAEGWERRFTAVGPRLAEAEATYRRLGFDVRIEHLDVEDLDAACTDCRLAVELFRVVYTRRAP